MATLSLVDPSSPLEARSSDGAHLSADRLGHAADLWALTGTALLRMSQLPSGARGSSLDAFGRMLSAALHDAGEQATHPNVGVTRPASDALDRVADRLYGVALTMAATICATEAASADGSTAAGEDQRWQPVLSHCQEAAGWFEQAGALRLADALLTAAQLCVPTTDNALKGRILAQRGRVARQSSNLDAAAAFYAAAAAIGRREADVDLVIRALMGRAGIATMRGNYPEARRLYTQTLRRATQFGMLGHASAARQGLLAAALAADDADVALEQGWMALEEAGNDYNRRSEILTLLAQVALREGFFEEALQGHLVAASYAIDPRLRLIALGGAAAVAGRLQRLDMVRKLAKTSEELLRHSPHAYENAFVTYELAAAFSAVGEIGHALALASEARRRSVAGTFFEVTHRVDELLERLEARHRASLTHRPPEGQVRIEMAAAEQSREPATVPDHVDSRTRRLNQTSQRVLRSLGALRLRQDVVAAGLAC